jgi:XTP/dITP diphosphohydrolase
MTDKTVVLATRNPGKLRELARILSAEDADGPRIPLAGLDSFPGAPDVPETGATFEENALLKARAIARYTGLPAVADDSGLCVDALNGMPGVLSARWAGRHGDDQANLNLVLAQVANVPDARRGAQFVCAAALVVPRLSFQEWVVTGRVEGQLTRVPRGTGGFGYDPIFLPDGFEQTTAEMTADAKDAISHRGRAFRALAPMIAKALVPNAVPKASPSRNPLARAGGEPVPARRAVALGSMTDKRLAPGDQAPDFTLPDADGHQVSLSSFRGQRVIVYFYPAAMTPGCTKEACDFRDNLADLNHAGIAVLGISPDQPAKLARFRDKEGLTFPLLSDPDHAVLEAYGAFGQKKLYGKTTVGVIRSTFVIDADGKVERAMYGVKATGHVARLRTEVGA